MRNTKDLRQTKQKTRDAGYHTDVLWWSSLWKAIISEIRFRTGIWTCTGHEDGSSAPHLSVMASWFAISSCFNVQTPCFKGINYYSFSRKNSKFLIYSHCKYRHFVLIFDGIEGSVLNLCLLLFRMEFSLIFHYLSFNIYSLCSLYFFYFNHTTGPNSDRMYPRVIFFRLRKIPALDIHMWMPTANHYKSF